MSFKSRRAKACDFPKKDRISIKERDSVNGRPCCIFCGSTNSLQIAHYISRSAGGLGIQENGACACIHCHQKLDTGCELVRNKLRNRFKQYLEYYYPFFEDDRRIYRK